MLPTALPRRRPCSQFVDPTLIRGCVQRRLARCAALLRAYLGRGGERDSARSLDDRESVEREARLRPGRRTKVTGVIRRSKELSDPVQGKVDVVTHLLLAPRWNRTAPARAFIGGRSRYRRPWSRTALATFGHGRTRHADPGDAWPEHGPIHGDQRVPYSTCCPC